MTDVAQGKTATASGIYGAGYEAAKAVDGNSGTRWASNSPVSTAWIYVDLLLGYRVTSVVLNWEAAYGKNYTIDVSPDAVNWTTIVTVTENASAGVKTYSGLTGAGRYVRVNVTQMRGEGVNLCSLWDFEVYGVPRHQDLFQSGDL